MPPIAKTGVEDLLHGRFRRPCARFMPPCLCPIQAKKRLQAPFKALVKRARKIFGGKQTVRGDHIFGRYFLRKRSTHRIKSTLRAEKERARASNCQNPKEPSPQKLQIIADFRQKHQKSPQKPEISTPEIAKIMPRGHKKGPGATDLLPNTQAIRLATKIEPISRPRVRSGQQTKQNGKRYAVGHRQQSRARSSVFLGFGYRRPHISRRQRYSSPLFRPQSGSDL